MISKQFKILIFLGSIGIFFIGWFMTILNSSDSFFAHKIDEYDITLQENVWDEYKKDRERRNRAKMKASYEELMRRGAEYSKRENYHDAAASYYFAKTIYPRHELPRRYLSESYMHLCSKYGEYCREAKKEVFYGFRYVKDTSAFYPDMMDMASALDLFPHLDKDEREVMNMIFKEKKIGL